MAFVPNEDLFCPICDVVYASANSAFALSCAKDGCKGHMCFDCISKAVFPGNRSVDPTCPHCRRVVLSYSYAFFETHKSVDALQGKIAQLESEVGSMKKNVAMAKADAEQATRRLDEWHRWATSAKSSFQGMPPSSMPIVVVGQQPESDMARSRSPRQVRPSGVMYAEYNG